MNAWSRTLIREIRVVLKLFVRRVVGCWSNRNAPKAGKVGSLLAAMVTSSVLIAAAQVNNAGMRPERSPVSWPQAQQFISTNALRAPAKAQASLKRAREELMRGRDAEAGKDLERALQIYPNYALALQLRGVMKMRSDHIEEACADFQQAIQSDPNLGAAYVALGAAYNRLGHFSDATLVLNRAAAILPRAWFAHYESALAYLGTGKIEAAWHAISRALDNLPDEPYNRSAIFYIEARVLLELKIYPEARAALEQSINEDPKGEFAKLALQLLDRLNAQGDHQEARSFAR